MSFKSILALFSASILLFACDDSNSTLGLDMMPITDLITRPYQETYDVTTSSYQVGDSVLARTSMSYLGQYTDPVTGTKTKSDFLSQYYCLDGKNFPTSILGDTIATTTIDLFINTFVGDSLAPMRIEVYELDSLLDPNQDFYTNINPEKFIKEGAKPVGVKQFTISDRTVTDSMRYANQNNKTAHISIDLDNTIGQNIFNGHKKDSTAISSTSKWLKSGLRGSKGFYFKLTHGDGVMASIHISRMSIGYTYYDEYYKKNIPGITQFAGTEEVVQATRFENENISKLMSDTLATYLKSPAGVFTLVEIPIDQVSTNDTINSASITFTRYNDSSYSNATAETEFCLSAPKTILMVRLDDYLNGFFENYKVQNNITSYTTTFSSSTNTYEFNNISRLLSTMQREKRSNTHSPNYNKVLLIPIEVTTNSSNEIVKINHDFSMSSARLVGGVKDKVKMEVIYSKLSMAK